MLSLKLDGGEEQKVEESSLDTKIIFDKKSKKKKNKKDSKKKRKRGKKRKHSSSSSDSDDDSDSSSSSSAAENTSKKNESNDSNKNSIRIAMRNISSKGNNAAENEKSGWTKIGLDPNKPPIPPPPAISQNASKETKKDEQIIGQWNSVPLMSQEEKRLLENLKGRLKQKEAEKSDDNSRLAARSKKSRSRSNERDKRNYRARKSRSRSPRRRSVSKSRSRSYSPASRRRRDGRYDRGNRSRYTRSRSRSKSSSRRFNRPTKPIVFPTEPRLPPLREEKQPARSYAVTKKKEDTSTSSSNASKKMPFIGKMPVFKKQLVEKKSEEQVEMKVDDNLITNAESLEEQNNKEDWNDLMPDPLQFSAIMNSAAPPPPIINSDEPDVPPGLDPDLDSEFIPKPISDAPIPRKGPLPSDLQATLDLLFDGDKPKPIVIEPVAAPEVPVNESSSNVLTDGPQMIMAEELSQASLLYGNYYQSSTTSDVQPVPPPDAPPLPSKTAFDSENGDKNDSAEVMDESDEKGKNQEDMDDLAMLGIDVNDVGSGFW